MSIGDGTRTPESENEWESNLREEWKGNQAERLVELESQAQEEHDKAMRELNARVEKGIIMAHDAESYRARLVMKMENYKRRIKKVLDDEVEQMLERERGLRKLSTGAIGLDSSELDESFIREQEEIFRQIQQGSASSREPPTPTAVPPRPPPAPPSPASTRSESRPAVWKPPSQTPDLSRSSSRYTPQAPQLAHRSSSGATSLSGSLFPQRPGQTSYHTWIPDSAYGPIHDEPEEMSGEDTEEPEEEGESGSGGEEESGSEEEEEGTSEEEDSYQYASSTEWMYGRVGNVPTKSAPLNIVQTGGRRSTSGSNR